MDVGFHQLAKCFINHTVAGKCGSSLKRFRHDSDVIVPATILRTSVSCVQVTLVLHQQFLRRERLDQPFLDLSDAILVHGGLSVIPRRQREIRRR